MGVKISGDKDLDKWLRKQPKEMTNTMRSGITLTAEDIRGAWQDMIRSMKAIKTSRYLQSIEKEISTSLLSAEVFTEVEYAVFVELGTSRMPARPAMMATANKMVNQLVVRLTEVIRKKYQ